MGDEADEGGPVCVGPVENVEPGVRWNTEADAPEYEGAWPAGEGEVDTSEADVVRDVGRAGRRSGRSCRVGATCAGVALWPPCTPWSPCNMRSSGE